jgi:hypothetical protein
VNPDAVTQERFKEITKAHEVLSDPDKRQMCDLGGDPFAASGGCFGSSPEGALEGGRVSPRPLGVASGTMATAPVGWCLESVLGSSSVLGLPRRAAAVVFIRLAATARGQATRSPADF